MSLRGVLRIGGLSVFLGLAPGCSEKLSPLETYRDRSRGQDCQSLNLGSQKLAGKDLKALARCLGQDPTLEGITALTDAWSDQDLQTVADEINLAIRNDPDHLSKLIESWISILDRPEGQRFMKETSTLLDDPQSRKDLALLAGHLPNDLPFGRMLDLTALAETAAWQRFAQEVVITDHFERFVQTVKTHRKWAEKSLSLIGEAKLKTTLDQLAQVENSRSLQNLGDFFSTLVERSELSTLSEQAKAISQTSITCFEGRFQSEKPINAVLKHLSQQPTGKAMIEAFQHDIRPLPWIARPFCRWSRPLDPAFDATARIFSLPQAPVALRFLRPLLANAKFTEVLTDPSFVAVLNDLQNTALRTHAIYDLITLGINAPEISLQFSPKLTDPFIDSGVRIIKRFVRKDTNYGAIPAKDLQLVLKGVPQGSGKLFEKFLKNKNLEQSMISLQKILKDNKLQLILKDLLKVLPQRGVTAENKSISATVTNVFSPKYPRLLLTRDAVLPLAVPSDCSQWNADFDWTKFSADTLVQVDLFLRCVQPRSEITRATRDFFTRMYERKDSGALVEFLSNALNGTFLNRKLALNNMDLVTQFPQVKDSFVMTLRAASALACGQSQNTALKNQMTRLAGIPELYSFLGKAVLQGLPPVPVAQRKSVTFTESTGRSAQALVDSSAKDKDRRVDPKIVGWTKLSAETVAQSLAQDFLISKPRWLDTPKTSWTFKGNDPASLQVHLNPVFERLKAKPRLLSQILLGLKGLSPDQIVHFFEAHSKNKQVVVYRKSVVGGKFSYAPFDSVGVFNDLELLEWIGFETDFIPPLERQNLGQKYIREIALGWGDVAPQLWPERIKRLQKKPCSRAAPEGFDSCIRSLDQVKILIKNQFDRYAQQPGLNFLKPCSYQSARIMSICAKDITDGYSRLMNLSRAIAVLNRTDLSLLRTLFLPLYDDVDLVPHLTRMGLLKWLGLFAEKNPNGLKGLFTELQRSADHPELKTNTYVQSLYDGIVVFFHAPPLKRFGGHVDSLLELFSNAQDLPPMLGNLVGVFNRDRTWVKTRGTETLAFLDALESDVFRVLSDEKKLYPGLPQSVDEWHAWAQMIPIAPPKQRALNQRWADLRKQTAWPDRFRKDLAEWIGSLAVQRLKIAHSISEQGINQSCQLISDSKLFETLMDLAQGFSDSRSRSEILTLGRSFLSEGKWK